VVGSFYTTFRLSSAPKYKILQALLAILCILSALAMFDMLSALLTLQRLFHIGGYNSFGYAFRLSPTLSQKHIVSF
jgi:hypothetical protein